MAWYRYSAIPGTDRLAPILEVVFWHGIRFARALGRLDTGSEATLLDNSYADLLQLPIESAEEKAVVLGDGELVDALQWPPGTIDLQFEASRVAIHPVFVARNAEGDTSVLLGRDLFQHFIFEFWESQAVFRVEELPPFLRKPDEGAI